MIKKIIVFGGGTSGWLTAAYLCNNLPREVSICLIEDAARGPIGVGEGTQPATSRFLYECGISPKDWMEPSNATFKHGVELTGWNKEPYFVDNDDPINYVATPDLFANSFFMNKPHKEFMDWHSAYQLAKNNKSPRLSEKHDCTFNSDDSCFGAVHFNAFDIIKTIKNLIINKITYIDTTITDVAVSESGVDYLLDKDGNKHSADLYLDCSGFESVLLEKHMKSEFISFSPWLMNDSAVAMPTQYTNKKEQMHPYTKATTMNAGWRWTIPVFNRIGNGYVYSSKFITPEEAEKELRDSIGEYDAKAFHLKMKCGTHEKVAVKNVVGIGLAAGFVEPLEATGITFTTMVVKALVNILKYKIGIWDEDSREKLNIGFTEMSSEILAFVFCHYYFSERNDTEYWKEVRKLHIDDLPEYTNHIAKQFYPFPKEFLYYSQQSMFTSVQWWQMIHANRLYKDYILTDDEQKYLEYFVNTKRAQTKEALKILPNHYEFLKGWYGRE